MSQTQEIKSLISEAMADLEFLQREAASESAAGEEWLRPQTAGTGTAGGTGKTIRLERTLTAQSQWARSQTPRSAFGTGRAGRGKGRDDAPATDLKPETSDRVVRQRIPAFTMGSSRRDFQQQVGGAGGASASDADRPLSYNGNVTVTSTKKRTIGGAFSSTPRFVERKLNYEAPAAGKVNGSAPQEKATGDEGSSVAGSDSTRSDPKSKRVMTSSSAAATGKAYSFGKAERSTAPIEKHSGTLASGEPETNDIQPAKTAPVEDVDKADRYIRPHTPGPTMRTAPNADRTALPWDGKNTDTASGFVDNGMALNDYLSNRPRTPAVVIRPSTAPQRRRGSPAKATARDDADNKTTTFPEDDEFGLSEIFGNNANGHTECHCGETPVRLLDAGNSTPGPGSYNPKLKGGLAGGRIYFQPKNKKKAEEDLPRTYCKALLEFDDDELGLSEILNRQAGKEKLSTALPPGPGAYKIDAADSVVRTSTPVFSYRQPAEEKNISKQLERKRYFEEKARDVRDSHIASPSLRLVQERSKGGLILPDKKAGIDERNRNAVLRMIRDRERVASLGYYDADQSVIEKRPVGAVTMSQEITARKKTEDKIFNKPGIAHVKVVREREKVANDQFLGPQLQVPWGDVTEDGKTKRQRTEGGVEEDLAMDEVYDMLNMRRDSAGRSKHYGEYSEAFIRSSFTGVDRGHGLISMDRGRPTQRLIGEKKLTAAEREQDYLSTQVHKDWGGPAGDESAPSGSKLLRLDLLPGREVTRVRRKGVAEVINFNEPVRNYDGHGPGEYGPEEVLEFGKSVKGGAVPFKDIVSRTDAVGPAGQPSEAAQERYRKLQHELEGGELELVAETAKDAIQKEPPKAFTLYAQDRFPVERPDDEDAGLDHLGGSYFEGMSDEVESRPALLKYDTMVGRTDKEPNKKGVAADDYDIDVPLTGDELNLEVNDWKPHFTKTHAVKWVDPADMPRFEKTHRGPKNEDAPDTVSPKYDQVHKRAAFTVDMSKHQGHFDEDDNLAGGDEAMPGSQAADVAQSFDEAMERGRYMKSNSKRVPVANLGKRTDDRGLVTKPKPGDDSEEVVLEEYEAADGVKQRQGVGATSYSKQSDRGLNPGGKDEAKDLDDEVNVSPHAEYKSNWKRTQGGAWSRPTEDQARVLEVDERLDIEPDQEKFMVGSGVQKGGTAMSKQIGRDGRQNKKPSNEAKNIIGTADSEQLDLDVRKDAKKLHSSVEWAKNDIPRRLYASQDPEMMQNLIIDPDEARNNNNAKETYARISNQPSRSSAVYNDAENETELMLSPKHDSTRASMKPQLSWNKQLDLKMPKLTESQELDLSPRDDVIRQSKIKDLPWKRASPTKLSEYDKRDTEELILSRSDNANRTEPTRQPAWAKQSEKAMDMRMPSEELVLSPSDEFNRRRAGKGAAGWAQQADLVRHTGYSPVQGPRDADDDEVILSPTDAASRPNVNKNTLNWSRQSDSRAHNKDARLSKGEEELILSPSKDHNRNNAGKVLTGWDKQQPRDTVAGVRAMDEEELMLSPKDVQRVSSQNNVQWSRQDDVNKPKQLKDDEGFEELMLSPKKPALTNRNKNILSWAKQNEDRSSNIKLSSHKDMLGEEQLILSPNDKSRPVAAGSNAPAWDKQSGNVDMERRLKDTDDEELELEPKQAARVSAGKGAGLWTKLSGPGAGANDIAIEQKYFEDSSELIISPKDSASYPDRGKFGKKERAEEPVPQHLDGEIEELILSPTDPRRYPNRGQFLRKDRATFRNEAKYSDEEELELSPKDPGRASTSGAAVWTKGNDVEVDMNKYGDVDEQLQLSPTVPADRTRRGEFRRSERGPTSIVRGSYDDEELNLSPREAPAFTERGKFAQSDRDVNALRAPVFDDDEELKLEPKAPARLNSAAGAGLFSKAAEDSVPGKYLDREDEELKLSPKEGNPFPKKGGVSYKDNEVVAGKLSEEEELKISPKSIPKNLGGKMAPPKPRGDSQKVPTSRESNKSGADTRKSSVTPGRSAVSTPGSQTMTPSASRGSAAKVAVPGAKLSRTATTKHPIKKSGVRSGPTVPAGAERTRTAGGSKPSSKNATRSTHNTSKPPLVSPPNVSVPSPKALKPVPGPGASRYDNVSTSAEDDKLFKMLDEMSI